ncbi:hypothetical protein VNO80_12128 [Phaseolus coccineus]|uniref:Uncharacterized protein n=1 Tax=Phaseolus coccineus TaxID=3886 RepID=A0AAN9NGM0_PHACN
MPNHSETVELCRQFVNHKWKIPNHSKTDAKRFHKIGKENARTQSIVAFRQKLSTKHPHTLRRASESDDSSKYP